VSLGVAWHGKSRFRSSKGPARLGLMGLGMQGRGIVRLRSSKTERLGKVRSGAAGYGRVW